MSETAKIRIVVIDDEAEMLENCQRIFSLWGYTVLTFQDSSDVSNIIQQHDPDLIFTDLKMPGKDGIAVLEDVQRVAPQIPVVIVTGFATVESAVEAVKKGAFDYITKPFTMDQLEVVTQRAIEKRRLTQENEELRRQIMKGAGMGRLIGISEPMRQVFDLIQRVAPLDANIVVTGESGTGKELVARAIHSLSRRREQRFVPIDCASLPETLLESELFGHEKGAFTGAIAAKPGLLEFADKGTLFLDEFAEMALSIQSKLLRAVQERTFRHVGGNELVETDIRLVAATNADIAKKVEKKEFREDLYYRLNVINIVLPSLRERGDDIPLLARHFFEQFSSTRTPPIQGITPEALAALQVYGWPGNVRELQNAVERAVALTESEYIEVGDLPRTISQTGPPAEEAKGESDDLLSVRKRVLRGFERDYVVRLLKEHRGNVSAAAREAGINRRTLYRLMQRYEIDVDSVR